MQQRPDDRCMKLLQRTRKRHRNVGLRKWMQAPQVRRLTGRTGAGWVTLRLSRIEKIFLTPCALSGVQKLHCLIAAGCNNICLSSSKRDETREYLHSIRYHLGLLRQRKKICYVCLFSTNAMITQDLYPLLSREAVRRESNTWHSGKLRPCCTERCFSIWLVFHGQHNEHCCHLSSWNELTLWSVSSSPAWLCPAAQTHQFDVAVLQWPTAGLD